MLISNNLMENRYLDGKRVKNLDQTMLLNEGPGILFSEVSKKTLVQTF